MSLNQQSAQADMSNKAMEAQTETATTSKKCLHHQKLGKARKAVFFEESMVQETSWLQT